MLSSNLLLNSFWVFYLLIYTQFYIFTQECREVENIISVLANDSLGGRGIHSEGIEKAKTFIVDELKKSKIKPYRLRNYFSNFTIPNLNLVATNIICKIDNKKDSTILFIAHYDHLDTCSLLSKEPYIKGKCFVHNGADDNASGVALVLLLAKHLKKQKKSTQKYNYLIAFTSAHEIGLYGSKTLIASNLIRRFKVKCVLNFDMVGRMNNSQKKCFISSSNPLKTEESIKKTHCENISIYFNNIQLFSSDITPFFEEGFYTISFTTGIHADYHRPSDDIGKINFYGIIEIKDLIISLIKQI